ncbi:hypothetical protein OFN62_30985, partial [Escherichia coli]|nr:hypothetical protein [Escherichia coli]
LVSRDGITAFELARLLFPQSFGRDVHTFLAVSEAIAHLDLAASEGKIGVRDEEGIEVYFR